MHLKSPFKQSTFDAFTTYMLLSAIATFAMSTISTINMVYQIKTVHLNALQLVLVGTTLETTCFLCQVPTGILADLYSHRLAVIAGYLLMGIGFILEGLIPTFLAVLVSQLIWGCGATFVTGAEEAWSASEIGEEKVGTAFIRATQIGKVATLGSIPLSIWLATYRLNLPVIVGAVLFIFLALVLYICMPERNFQPASDEEQHSWRAIGHTFVNGGKAVSKSRMLLMILGITVFSAMASEGFDRLQTDHFTRDFSFPPLAHFSPLIWYGVISAGAALLGLLIAEFLRKNVNTNNTSLIIQVMFALKVLLIVSVAIFALAGNFFLALGAFWCASVFRSVDTPLYNTWITTNSDPKMRATIFSLFGQVDAIGQIAGGPVVGYIGTVISLRAALLTTSAILIPCIPFFVRALIINKRTRSKLDSTPDSTRTAAG